MARHVKIPQNNNVAIFLQYLKKEGSDEVDFLHAHQYKSFLQIDAMIFDGDDLGFQSC